MVSGFHCFLQTSVSTEAFLLPHDITISFDMMVCHAKNDKQAYRGGGTSLLSEDGKMFFNFAIRWRFCHPQTHFPRYGLVDTTAFINLQFFNAWYSETQLSREKGVRGPCSDTTESLTLKVSHRTILPERPSHYSAFSQRCTFLRKGRL